MIPFFLTPFRSGGEKLHLHECGPRDADRSASPASRIGAPSLKRLFAASPTAAAWALALLLSTPLAGEEPRTFTNKEGRSIVAEAIGIDPVANEVTLRTADGRTFNVPIANLSLDDQAFLAESKGRIAASLDPGGWKQVEIQLPLLESKVSAPGIYGACYRIGATRWAGELPEGAWLHVQRVIPEGDDAYIDEPELLLRFDGSWKSLSIRFEEGRFSASFDGAEPKLVGFTCKIVPSARGADPLTGIRYFDEAKTAELQVKSLNSVLGDLEDGHRICLQPALPMMEPEVRRYRGKIESIIAHRQSAQKYAALVDKFELRAFKVAAEGSVSGIEPSKHLEYLGLGYAPDDLRPLILHPALTTLELGGIHSQEDLDVIAEIPGIRHVKINRSHDSDTVFQINRWATLANLVAIDFPARDCKVSAASVASCAGLRAVRFEDPGAGTSTAWLDPLVNLRNVHWQSALGNAELLEYAKTAKAAPAIRFLWNFNNTFFANLPSLRAVEQPGFSQQETWSLNTPELGSMSRSGMRPYVWPVRNVNEAENLEYLAISGVSQEFLNQLVAKKNPESLKVLILSNLVDCTDLSGLKVFKNLRVLSISTLFESFPGLVTQRLTMIDLTELPSLEAVEVLPFYEDNGLVPVEVRLGNVPFQRINDRKGPPTFIPWGDLEAR